MRTVQLTYRVFYEQAGIRPLKQNQHAAYRCEQQYPMMGKHFGNYSYNDGDFVSMIEMN